MQRYQIGRPVELRRRSAKQVQIGLRGNEQRLHGAVERAEEDAETETEAVRPQVTEEPRVRSAARLDEVAEGHFGDVFAGDLLGGFRH